MTTSIRTTTGLLLALSAMLLASPAGAASPLVDARLAVTLIRSDGAFETAAAATSAKPGDLLEYTARYLNRGDGSASALMPTMPVPAGTEYVPDAGLAPKPTQASLDTVTYAPIPLRRKQRGADGTTRDVDVPFSEYRALRWTVGTLAAGSEVTVRARVRVVARPDDVASR